MDHTKVQIQNDYCKDVSQEEISAILDRLSVLLSNSYSRPICNNEEEKRRNVHKRYGLFPHLCAVRGIFIKLTKTKKEVKSWHGIWNI